ncbi:MAG: hypothetical protein SFW67_22915 [Myxococcaceae bacterium]|nr:hypothetical protein [Myxococcaceae bacterium]
MRVLDRELQGTVRFRTVEHLEPEAVEAKARYRWESHGAVGYRGRRLFYRAGDHRVNARDMHERILDELGLPPECRVFTTAPSP